MSELGRRYLKEFSFGNRRFGGAALYTLEGSSYAMLVSRSGSTLFFTRRQAELLAAGEPSEPLMDKLMRKGFCEPECSRPVAPPPIAPDFFMIDITTRCNMNCYYCLRHIEDSGEIISEDRLRDILDYIVEYYHKQGLTALSVQPWGGEPVIALERILFLRNYLEAHRVHAEITIQSNALTLTPDTARVLSENGISVGVSLDGCREVHDLHRRDLRDKPTYMRVLRGISNWREASGKTPGTISVVSKMSVPLLERSMEVLVKEVGVESLKMNLMHPNSELFDLSSMVDVAEIPDIFCRIMDKVIALHAEGHHVVENNTADRVSNLLCGTCPDLCHSRGCCGGYRLISFSQDGSIYPCETIGIKEYRLGSIYDGVPLMTLIQRSIAADNPYFAEKKDVKCEDCEWFSFCRGGCTASARFHGRESGQIDEKECAVNRAVYPELIVRLLRNPDTAAALTDGKIELK